jgi:hypothetical protein
MNKLNVIAITILVALYLSSCKKDLDNESPIILEEKIAAKYGLKKIKLQDGQKVTKKFANSQEMEAYFENRFKKLKKKKHSKYSSTSTDDYNIIDSYSSNLSGSPTYSEPALFIFPGFANYGFPDHFQCELYPNYFSWIWGDPSTISHNFLYSSNGGTIYNSGFRFYGVYTEIYGGEFSQYFQIWNLEVIVEPYFSIYSAYGILRNY